MKHADHKKLLSRVNRINGQISGIGKMIDDGAYCVDIMTQIKAARSALKSLELQILEGHLHHCVAKAVKSEDPNEVEEKVNEILELIQKSSKS